MSALRLRLAIEGDLGKAGGTNPNDAESGMFSAKWGPDLTEAVKRFQTRHGLKETGVVAGAEVVVMAAAPASQTVVGVGVGTRAASSAAESATQPKMPPCALTICRPTRWNSGK